MRLKNTLQKRNGQFKLQEQLAQRQRLFCGGKKAVKYHAPGALAIGGAYGACNAVYYRKAVNQWIL